MEFELLHSSLDQVLKPLRDALRDFVLEHRVLALLALCVLPTGLLYLSHRAERELERATPSSKRASDGELDQAAE